MGYHCSIGFFPPPSLLERSQLRYHACLVRIIAPCPQVALGGEETGAQASLQKPTANIEIGLDDRQGQILESGQLLQEQVARLCHADGHLCRPAPCLGFWLEWVWMRACLKYGAVGLFVDLDQVKQDLVLLTGEVQHGLQGCPILCGYLLLAQADSRGFGQEGGAHGGG